MSNNKNQSKQPKFVRVMAIILAALMLAGAATIVFSLLGGHVH